MLKASTRYNSLKVLDLSWNSLGRLCGKEFANQFAELLRTQDYLIHMDLSHNKFKSADSCIIATALSSNHNLWGFHYVGNGLYNVDAKGFLVELPINRSIGIQHIETRIGRFKTSDSRGVLKKGVLKKVSNCWICEGWQEFMVKYPMNDPNEPVYLNMQCNDYKADLMNFDNKSFEYTLWRMWPPGKTKFFFTFEGKAVISDKYPKSKCRIRKRIKVEDELYPYVDADLDEVNYLFIAPNPKLLDDNFKINVENCFPRPFPECYYRPRYKRQRTPWTFPISIFKTYVIDTEVFFKTL